MEMKYVALFHANLNYAFLEEYKYEQVIRASYETIFDVFREKAPDCKYVFEASGFTIKEMAEKTPDVLQKLIDACKSGQCEFMGAPYAHPIMANVPQEDGYWSNYFSMQTYEKYLGFKPVSTWNPECTWMQYVPKTFRDAGYKYMCLDFESYMASNDKDYAWVEKNRTRDIGWGGNLPSYNLDPNCKFLHRPFKDVVPGLGGFCRSDRLIGHYVSYFLGRIPLQTYLDTIKKWTGNDVNGATMIIADDAEYTGTTGYFFVKYFRDYSKSFAIDPTAADKLEALINGVKGLGGEFITFREACELEPVEEPYYVEDRSAWHKTYADAWAGTPEAKGWEPTMTALRREYKENYQAILENDPKYRDLVEKFWFHMTSSANSDGRWPPPPAQTCEFNRDWCLNEMAETRKALDEINVALKDVPRPAPAEEPDGPTSRTSYDLDYTEKDTSDLKKLNFYELSHHLYASFALFDNGEGAEIEEGRKRVNAIFEEFGSRGFTGMTHRRV
ncbi:MAG: hypothetical protein WCL54_02640 [Clostridia bacterium]